MNSRKTADAAAQTETQPVAAGIGNESALASAMQAESTLATTRGATKTTATAVFTSVARAVPAL